MPLSKMLIVHPDASVLDGIKTLLKYVHEESNVKQVEFSTDEEKYSLLQAVPDHATLGKRIGKPYQKVRAAIQALGNDVLRKFKTEQRLDLPVEGVTYTFTSEDIKLTRALVPTATTMDMHINVDLDLVVALDTVVTQEMKEEGMARDIATRVQRLRKKAGLSKEDIVEVYYEDASGVMEALITRHMPLIRNTLKVRPLPKSLMPKTAFTICQEQEIVRSHFIFPSC